MALWHCTACTAAYSVGAPACPHCGGTEHQDDAVEIAVVEDVPAVDAPVLRKRTGGS